MASWLASLSQSDGNPRHSLPTIARAEAKIACGRVVADWRCASGEGIARSQPLAASGTPTEALAQCWMTASACAPKVIAVDNAATCGARYLWLQQKACYFVVSKMKRARMSSPSARAVDAGDSAAISGAAVVSVAAESLLLVVSKMNRARMSSPSASSAAS